MKKQNMDTTNRPIPASVSRLDCLTLITVHEVSLKMETAHAAVADGFAGELRRFVARWQKAHPGIAYVEVERDGSNGPQEGLDLLIARQRQPALI